MSISALLPVPAAAPRPALTPAPPAPSGPPSFAPSSADTRHGGRAAEAVLGGGSVSGGGLSLGRITGKLRGMLLYGAMGAAAGIVFPVIPGGPVGGAIIGAMLSLIL